MGLEGSIFFPIVVGRVTHLGRETTGPTSKTVISEPHWLNIMQRGGGGQLPFSPDATSQAVPCLFKVKLDSWQGGGASKEVAAFGMQSLMPKTDRP